VKGRTSYLLSGERVAKARLAITDERGRPISQQELANRADLNRVTVAKIEGNKQRVSLEVLERLTVALGRSREYLLGEPEQVDEFEIARARLARATTMIVDGFEEAGLVLDLVKRVREAGVLADRQERVEA
jgi:transcriptional regulator with XRE-family HTH domain